MGTPFFSFKKMDQSKSSIFHFKNKKFPDIFRNFFGLPIHFGVCASAHCAYTGLSFGSRIARPQRYVYECMDFITTLNANFIICFCNAHFIMPQNALIYVHFCMLFAGLLANNFCVAIFLPKNMAIKVCVCLHELLNNI